MLFSIFTPQTEFEFSGISINLLTSWSPPIWLFPSSKVSLSNPFSITSPSSFFFSFTQSSLFSLTQRESKTRKEKGRQWIELSQDQRPEISSAQFRRHQPITQKRKTTRPWSPVLVQPISTATIKARASKHQDHDRRCWVLILSPWFCRRCWVLFLFWWMGFVDDWWVLLMGFIFILMNGFWFCQWLINGFCWWLLGFVNEWILLMVARFVLVDRFLVVDGG